MGWRHWTPINRLSLMLPLLFLFQVASAQFTVNFSVTEPTCFGQPNGSATAIPDGGVAPFTYLWSTGDTGPTISNIPAGTYSVTVVDATAFTVIKNVTVTQPDVVDVDLMANTCQIPITITATGSGGDGPYNYNWSTGATGSTITVPAPGTYCVTMTDQNLCGAVECINVNVNPLNVGVTATNLTCSDSNDGIVQAMPSGGTPPYSYQWSNGATGSIQTNLPAGTYTVTVTDAAGCMDSATGVVTAPPPLVVNATGTSPNCGGETTGQVTASASGGTPPYNYTWNTGAMTPTVNNLGQGTYTVTVTDANGCTAIDQVTLTPVSNLDVTATPDGENCSGANDGSVTANPVNGVPPYTYLWSNGGSTQTISNLQPGVYSVTVIDAAGCSAVASATVTSAPAFAISVTSTNVTICDGNNGTATANIIQGQGPFSYEWSSGQTSQTIGGLGGGTYIVTVTDGNGCTRVSSTFISTPPQVSVSIIADDVVCPGGNTGSATAIPSGGTPPYSFMWNNGSTNMMISGLQAGTYTVTLTDAAQCTDEASVTITESPAVNVTISGTETICDPEGEGNATANASGGVPPYSYQWSNGSNTPTVTDLPEGSYSVTVTDALGCTAVETIDVDIIDDFVLDIAIQNVLCFGESTGSILAEGWGGTPPYTYQWSNGVTGTPLLENIPAGSYSVTVTEQNGCVLVEDFIITEPPLLNASASGSGAVCPGAADGMASANASGGTLPYSYEWSNGQTTQTIGGLNPGTYTVTVTDANGCQDVASVTLTQAPGAAVVVTGTEVVCGTGNLGSASATPTAGTPPFSFSWSNGSASSIINNLPAGTYTVTVTDANGCTATDGITINVVDDITLSADVKSIRCFGESNGEITVTPSGGDAPYTYQWSNGPTTPMITGLGAGTYTVTVTDANGCTASQTYIVMEPPLLNVNAVGTDVLCPGETTGTANAVAFGGTAPYTYEWSTGATTQVLNGLGAGTYTVTATDASNCTAVGTVTIDQAQAPIVTISATEVVCGEGSTGDATANVVGGTPPYTYLWSNGATTPTVSNLPEGTYTVTVTDANGCTGVAQEDVDVIDDFEVMLTPSNLICNNDNSGRVLATPSGGTPPYTYQWSNGATSNEILGLPAGTYSLTVTDANGCTATGSITLTQPPALIVNLNDNDITCNGDNDGSITSSVSGGTPPYAYNWNNGATIPNLSGLAPGTYILTVTDANGCTNTASATITQPDAINVNVSGQDLLCNGDNSGTATATASGGTPPYSYAWNTGAATSMISNLPAGTYTVTVTDANGCDNTASVTISQPSAVTVTLDDMDIFCDGVNDGSITATPGGGTPPYTFEWNTGATTATISNLPAGTYTVTVTDVNECQAVASATIEEFPGLMLAPVASSPDCFGEITGTASVNVSGGTAPFSYEWSNSETTQTITGLPAGTYTVTVTDAVGCTGVETVGVTQPEQLIAQVTSTNTTDVECNGDNTGSATITVNGGTAPFSYLWSDGQTTQTATGLAAGNYSATVTDANGCTDVVNVTIDEPTAINLSTTATVANTCENATDGAITSNVSGGTPPYSYVWNNGATTPNLGNLAAGTYVLTVTDANGCTAVSSATVGEFDAPTCTINVTNEVLVGNDGEATIIVTGGTAPFDYQWSDGQTTQTAVNLAPGTYSATVTDANGCMTTCDVTLDQPAKLGDYVWLDEDRDGIQDPNEDGIEGVMVILQAPDGTNLDTTFTDANGFYHFDVLPGDYKVSFIAPPGLLFTQPNQGGNDALDSDVDPAMGMTGVYTIAPGETNFTIDAGLFDKCDNIDDAGQIGVDQFLCGPGNDPDPLVNIVSPSGGSGAIEYLWMSSTEPGPFNIQTWTVIPGATGDSYDPGPVYETTYFARCARRECCTVYLESNIVTIEVGSVAVADIQGPDFICVGEPTTFFAAGAGADADIQWSFSAGVSPQTATGPQVTISVNSPGAFTITLQVIENGCTSTDIETVTGTASPIYCAGLLPIDVQVADNTEGEVNVSWMMEDQFEDYTFEVQHSTDKQNFEAIGYEDTPAVLLGAMDYFEHLHLEAKRGYNYYRLLITAPNGDTFFSEVDKAILYNDSKVAMLYPNPVSSTATLELFETFGQDMTIEITAANGARMQTLQVGADTEQVQLDCSNWAPGTYLLRLSSGGNADVKVLKLLKQ